MKRLLLALAVLFMPAVCFGQNTIITATITDPIGLPYTFLTGSASLNCPGNQQPTYNGYTVPRNFTIVGGDGNGHFTQVLYDVNLIQPAGCSYRYAITWKDGITAFIAPSIGASGSGTPVTGAGPVDLSAAISAFSVPLPIPASGFILNCTTNGGVGYENGTSNTLTCDGSNVYNVVSHTATLASLVPATAGPTNQSSPTSAWCGNYWTGSASAQSCFNVQTQISTMPSSTLLFRVPTPSGTVSNSQVKFQMGILTIGDTGVTGAIQMTSAGGGLWALEAANVGTSMNAWSSPTANPVNTQVVTATVGNPIGIQFNTAALVDVDGSTDKTAQTAAIGTTTLFTPNSGGAFSGTNQYRVNWNAKVTTPATTGAATSTLGALTIVYKDPDGVTQTITCPATSHAGTIETTDTGNATTTVLIGVPLLLNTDGSTAVTYAFAYASNTAAQMAYNLHIRVEGIQ
jgi:hypothetical protein